MKAAGVRTIRFGMEDKEDENLDFIKRAYAQNIRIVLIFHGKYAPWRSGAALSGERISRHVARAADVISGP